MDPFDAKSRKVLIIDHDPDNSALLAHSIRGKFPDAGIVHSSDAVEALSKMVVDKYDVVIVHRTEQIPAVNVIRTIRKVDGETLIIAVSGIDRSEDVLQAGADGFLHYDEWARIGAVIANALELREAPPGGAPT